MILDGHVGHVRDFLSLPIILLDDKSNLCRCHGRLGVLVFVRHSKYHLRSIKKWTHPEIALIHLDRIFCCSKAYLQFLNHCISFRWFHSWFDGCTGFTGTVNALVTRFNREKYVSSEWNTYRHFLFVETVVTYSSDGSRFYCSSPLALCVRPASPNLSRKQFERFHSRGMALWWTWSVVPLPTWRVVDTWRRTPKAPKKCHRCVCQLDMVQQDNSLLLKFIVARKIQQSV